VRLRASGPLRSGRIFSRPVSAASHIPVSGRPQSLTSEDITLAPDGTFVGERRTTAIRRTGAPQDSAARANMKDQLHYDEDDCDGNKNQEFFPMKDVYLLCLLTSVAASVPE